MGNIESFSVHPPASHPLAIADSFSFDSPAPVEHETAINVN